MPPFQGLIILFVLGSPVPGVLQSTLWAQTYADKPTCQAAVDVKAAELNATVPPGVVWAGVCFQAR